ncbi:hypothetical protein DEM27_11655 [Metarhizobium album]|uniref:Arc-like DNA binding domain-containing protein n=2 Tax=Metarhizobium album TaxID=2182425 RepID=A0A2U2DS14_9HYPH|nr:hypothetical protein DEM27_11655 [Rhizobium album]
MLFKRRLRPSSSISGRPAPSLYCPSHIIIPVSKSLACVLTAASGHSDSLPRVVSWASHGDGPARRHARKRGDPFEYTIFAKIALIGNGDGPVSVGKAPFTACNGMSMSKNEYYLRLRIPETMRRDLMKSATLNNRSMTAEILTRLQNSFETGNRFEAADDSMQEMRDRISCLEEQFRHYLATTNEQYPSRKTLRIAGE